MPDGTIITPDIRDAERLQGFPADWTAAARTVARASSRWSLVGSAVTAPVAAWLGHRLAQPGSYESSRDRVFVDSGRWPRAARYDGTRRSAVEIGAFPVWNARPALVDFLQYPGKPLSYRASRGFLSRAERSSLRFVDGFKDRVRAHVHSMNPV